MDRPQSVALQPELELAHLAHMAEGTRVHSGLAIARGAGRPRLGAAAPQRRQLWHPRRWRQLPRAAFAGVSVTRMLVLVAMLSGGLAGLAGAIEVAGRPGYVTLDMSPGYGYGATAASLSRCGPACIRRASPRRQCSWPRAGRADSMSRAIGVPTYLADVLVAVSLLSVPVAALAAQYRLRLRLR